MNEIILNASPLRRTKLTREELLAGKCFPENADDSASDPRLRSPDEILAQKAPRIVSKPSDDSALAILALQKRYEDEIASWRVYEKQVQEWKKNVSNILEQYKTASHEKDLLIAELTQAVQKIKQPEVGPSWLRQSVFDSTSITL